jgi:hypothetical protein
MFNAPEMCASRYRAGARVSIRVIRFCSSFDFNSSVLIGFFHFSWTPRKECCVWMQDQGAVMEEIRWGDLTVYFAYPEFRRLISATYAIALPHFKPRALCQLLIVPSIGSRNVAGAQRPRVRPCEQPFQQLDVGNGLFRIHTS